MRVEQLPVLRVDLAVLLLELRILSAISLARITFPQDFARAHGRAHAMELREAVIGKPGFVPKEDDVGLDR